MMNKRMKDSRFLLIIAAGFMLIFFFCLPFAAGAEEHEAGFTPWSGYWWPFNNGGLSTGVGYRGHPAPLEKYELLEKGAYPGALTEWYNERYYDPEAPSWYGLCGEWAMAACIEKYEILPSVEDGIVFRVGDKKGLLTMAHDNNYIERADGSRPEIFHYWLLNFIKDKGEAFVADLSTGGEVWCYPIYKYVMESTLSGNIESVSVIISHAKDNVPPDYMGTESRQEGYTYDIFLNANGEIIGGEWTGASVSYHPEKLLYPLDVQPACPYLDYEEVVRLARSRDDELEKPGEVVKIEPGTYNLILLDEDVYQISCLPGNMISIVVEKQPGSSEDITCVVKDGSDDEVESAMLNDENQSTAIVITALDPPYTVHLTQNNYDDPNIYTITFDLKRDYNQRVPYIPKNGDWSGFALTNPGAEVAENVTLTTYTVDGEPIQTVSGPLNMAPGEKKLFFFDNLPWNSRDYARIENLVLMSDNRVDLLNLFGNENSEMSCFAQKWQGRSQLVIPDIVSAMNYTEVMIGGIVNESFETAPVTVRVFSAGGILQSEMEEVIDPRAVFPIRPGQAPFYNPPDGGWMEIDAHGNPVLSGYQYVKLKGNGSETLFDLDMGSVHKIVPHIPTPGYWSTTATIINPQDVENRVTFHLRLAGDNSEDDITFILGPYEKKIVELDMFGKKPGDLYYHSILDIYGEYPVTGYYTFRTPNDHASCPFLDNEDFKAQLVLPHYPGNDGYWWTGVNICNASDVDEMVRIEPYDKNGKLIEDSIENLFLGAGAYDVFTVASVFEETASDISFIKFCVEGSEGGSVGGFYLYGTETDQMLSGANM